MNILVIGQAGHGKDEFGKIIEKLFGMTYLSSSEYMLNRGVFDFIWEHEGYSNRSHFWLYKDKYRPQLFKAILEYNDPGCRLASEIFETAHCYVGMRSRKEFQSCVDHGLFDHVIWVDAFDRLGDTETESSNELRITDADHIIKNNETVWEFEHAVKELIEKLIKES